MLGSADWLGPGVIVGRKLKLGVPEGARESEVPKEGDSLSTSASLGAEDKDGRVLGSGVTVGRELKLGVPEGAAEGLIDGSLDG